MQKLAINVVRSSLQAAQDALNLLEQLNGTTPAVAQVSTEAAAAPTADTTTVAAAPTHAIPVSTIINQLSVELNDSRYSLRTVAELADKLDVTPDVLLTVANSNFDIVERNRRSDGALLIGLASRN